MARIKHTYKGQTLGIGEWAKILNVKTRLLCTRIYRDGWTLEEAFTTKVRNRKPDEQRLNYDDGVEMYLFSMRRFYTKQHRLESYKRVIAEMKQQRMRKAA